VGSKGKSKISENVTFVIFKEEEIHWNNQRRYGKIKKIKRKGEENDENSCRSKRSGKTI
jgi:hypothetical protein